MVSKTEPLGRKQVRDEINSNNENVVRPNHRGRGLTPPEKRRMYAKYNDRKKLVYEAEERNFQHLVMFLASDGENPEKKKKFYVMGGHSALIFVSEIAPRIQKKRVILRPDLDNTDYRFKTGLCYIGDIDAMTERLKEVGVERVLPKKKLENTGDVEMIVYFKLPRKYEMEEIRQMSKTLKKEKDDVNKVLYSPKVYPNIYKHILVLRRMMYHKVKNMQPIERELLGTRLIEPIFEIMALYDKVVSGVIDDEVAAYEMLTWLNILRDRVSMLMDLELWDVISSARVGEILAEFNNAIKGEFKEIFKGEGDAAKK